jgi:hypothetical protein
VKAAAACLIVLSGCDWNGSMDGQSLKIELGAIADVGGSRVALGAVSKGSYRVDGTVRSGRFAVLEGASPRLVGTGDLLQIGGSVWQVVAIKDPLFRTRWSRPAIVLRRLPRSTRASTLPQAWQTNSTLWPSGSRTNAA